MPSIDTWLVDSVAAENLARRLDQKFSKDQLATIATHFAEHRRNTIELTTSSLTFSVQDVLREVIVNGQRYRSADWSDGCRSAEEAAITAMARKSLEIAPPRAASRGVLLRSKLQHARKRAEAAALTTKISAAREI